jgi:spermidine/putrescine transport system substrate-binding protein
VHLTRREILLSGSMLLAGACTRPGSNSAPQQFGVAAAKANVQVLDPQLVLSLPGGVVAPTTVSSFVSEFGVKVTVTPGRVGELTQVGATDVALTDDVTLTRLVSSKVVESIDRSLVTNRKLLVPPFDNPSYDRGNHHSVPKDYITAGFAYSVASVPTPLSTWRGFFRLAAAQPGRVAVPPDRDIVIGAALIAAGHDWNTSSSSDISDAADILLPLRPALVIGGVAGRRRLPSTLAAALCFGPGFAAPPAGIRFAVPQDGTLVRARCYCIPAYAPDPVSAHAWLNHTLDPAVAATETHYTGRATPVGPAVYQLPSALIANQAVFPPALPATPLTFANLNASGAQLRTDLWAELTAGRKLRLPAR